MWRKITMVYPIYHKPSNWVDVAQMYEYAKSKNLELLSMFNADFWNDYITNSGCNINNFRSIII